MTRSDRPALALRLRPGIAALRVLRRPGFSSRRRGLDSETSQTPDALRHRAAIFLLLLAALTEMFPSRFGIRQHFATPAQNLARNMPDWLDPRGPSLPRFLQQAGYRTAHFGKWHLTNRNTRGAPDPTAYGFDEYAVFNGDAETASANLHATPENAAKFIQAHKGRPF